MNKDAKMNMLLIGVWTLVIFACIVAANHALAEDLPDGIYIQVDPDSVYCVGDDCDIPVPPEPVDPPIAVDDTYIFDSLENVCDEVNVLDNDISPQGLPLEAIRLPGDGPYHGNLILDPDGTCTYQRYPTSDALGDHFGYYAGNETEGTSNKAMVHFRWGDTPTDPCEENPSLPQCLPPVDPCEDDPSLPECQPPIDPDPGERPPVTYQPPLPPLGEYSVPMCAEVESGTDTVVTLQSGELLMDAYARLRASIGTMNLLRVFEVARMNTRVEMVGALSALLAKQGGVLEVPWNAQTVDCDNLRINENRMLDGNFTFKGLPGPNGEQPRFYCRSETRDGTIPQPEVVGEFFAILGEQEHSVLMENIHVDGYKKAVIGPRVGHMVLRNNYLHHGLSDGISQSNNQSGLNGSHMEICGNEIAHFGQGNTIHNSYIHRSLGGADEKPGLEGNPSWNTLWYVDNLCHSSPFSHCLKSTANENHVVGNRMFTTLATDPSYSERNGSTLIDLIACGLNDIRDNYLYSWKPEAGKYGEQIIGLRNRRTAVRGCDIPVAWTTDIPPEPVPGPVHTDAYWTALNGEIKFPTTIEGNDFHIDGEYGWRYYATTMYGTYPNHETTLGSPSCWLPTPDTWYERARVYADNNDYYGFAEDKLYRNMPPGHNYYDHCPLEDPPGPGPYPWIDPGPAPWDEDDQTMFEWGAGENIIPVPPA